MSVRQTANSAVTPAPNGTFELSLRLHVSSLTTALCVFLVAVFLVPHLCLSYHQRLVIFVKVIFGTNKRWLLAIFTPDINARMLGPCGFSVGTNKRQAPYKRTQHCWPTTPNTVECYMLRPFAHPVACCWMLLRRV